MGCLAASKPQTVQDSGRCQAPNLDACATLLRHDALVAVTIAVA